jgi:hypothetical protein
MKNLTILAVLLSSTVAMADAYHPMILRQSANHYALVGEGTLVTNDCTVSADGKLTAKVDHERGKMFVTFLDRDGAEEGQCEVTYTVQVTPTTVATVKPAHTTRVASR